MSDFIDKARAAERAMREVFPETPLLRNEHLSERYGANILLKREDLTPVRSYKLRGAFNAMRKVMARGEAPVFVCASAGNHAQGVAFMCQHFGVRGVIFMPVTTPQQKIGKTAKFGGESVEIKLIGDYFDDTLAAAQAHCAQIGGHFLPPFDDEDVIEGQASVAAEIEAQLGGLPDEIVMPVGGGGLSSGVRSYFGDRVGITLVEPEGGACLNAALAAGDSRGAFVYSGLRAVLQVGCLLVGFRIAGLVGGMVSYGVAMALVHPLLIRLARRHQAWGARHDAGFALLATLIIGAVVWLHWPAIAALSRAQ